MKMPSPKKDTKQKSKVKKKSKLKSIKKLKRRIARVKKQKTPINSLQANTLRKNKNPKKGR